MKRLTALLLCLLLCLCACTAPAVQTVSSAVESMSSSVVVSGSSSGVSDVSSAATGSSGTAKIIDTNILTEKKAHEILNDSDNFSQYCTQNGYVLSRVWGATDNIQPLTDWLNCYKQGIASEVVVLYWGWTIPLIIVFTSNGTQQYTITLYDNFGPSEQYRSSVITERSIDYTFGKDLGVEWEPITIRKPYDAEDLTPIQKYENTLETYTAANLKAEPFYAYVYDAKAKDYTKKASDTASIRTLRDFFTGIEESLAVKLDISRIVQDGDLIYINFEPDSAPAKGLTKEQEQAVLYSLSRTVMENQKGVLGVCFEIVGESYHSENFYFGQNWITLPPNAPALGKLSVAQAEKVARDKLIELAPTMPDQMGNMDIKNLKLTPEYAKYECGILCYVFTYYYNESYRSQDFYSYIVVDAETGTLFFDISMEDGSYMLIDDENEKQITPQTK